MTACSVSITTRSDGVETKFNYEGEMSLCEKAFEICYFEPQAKVRLLVNESGAEMAREGDYTLRLFFEKDVLLNGTLGIASSEGSVQTRTRQIAYSIKQKSVLLSIKYDLIIGTEKQRMEIRILAREKGNSKDKVGEKI